MSFWGQKGQKNRVFMVGYGPSFNFYEKNSKIQRNGPPKVVDKIEHEIIRVQDGIMNTIREMRWSI